LAGSLGGGVPLAAIHLLSILWILVIHDRRVLEPTFDTKSPALRRKTILAGIALAVVTIGWLAFFFFVVTLPNSRFKTIGPSGVIIVLLLAYEAFMGAYAVFGGHKLDLPILLPSSVLIERCIHDNDDQRLRNVLCDIAGIDAPVALAVSKPTASMDSANSAPEMQSARFDSK